MVIHYFYGMPTASTNFVNLEWRKLGHTTIESRLYNEDLPLTASGGGTGVDILD